MNGYVVALLMLALGFLIPPVRERARLLPTVARRRRLMGSRVAALVLVGAVVGATAVSPGLGLSTALVSATAFLRYRRHRQSARRRTEGRLIAAALELLVGELRAGAHPVDAFEAAGSEAGEPVAGALLTVASRARLGADVATGLRAVGSGSAAGAYWERIAACWHLAAEHGLAMSTLMAAARDDIVSRERFSDGLHAGLAGARATATILAVMPVIGLLLGELIGAHPLSFLLNGHVGGVLLTIGTVLMCAGVLWSDRIVDGVVP